MKEWLFRARDGAPSEENMAGSLGVSPRMARLLWLRGMDDPLRVRQYLNPSLRHLAHPKEWPGMERAAEILASGIQEGKLLAVWGDYDVDGVTSTALVRQVLGHYGYSVLWHLPDRRSEGYGMNVQGVERLAERGARLLLTVDCGISDVAAVRRARDLGMSVVVTDHHLPPENLPDADVLCDPRLGACPCASLAGVGVTFFLMAALNSRLSAATGKPRLDMRKTLDLVALGTLADLVELEGQNRILVKNGLVLLAEASRPGVSALKSVSGYSQSARLGAGQVVFGLAPRINAAGRMASAEAALELLCTADRARAASLAQDLDACNSERRGEEERITREAVSQVEERPGEPAMVVVGPAWNQGVVGIVASRLVERYRRPAIVLGEEGGMLKGSGRSVAAFDLHAALARCSGDLVSYGGHRMAAGLRLLPGNLESFRGHFLEAVRDALGPDPAPDVQLIDFDLDFRGASDFVFLKELEMMQPFGVGNPEPVFRSPPLLIVSRRVFGPLKNHVELKLRDESCGVTLMAKAWQGAGDFPASVAGTRVRLAYSPSIDMYNGIASVQVRMRDWRRA